MRNKSCDIIETQQKDIEQKQKMERGGNNKNEKIYYSAEDIAKMLDVSTGKLYKIAREMNRDLAGKGFLTIAGKITVKYFKEKCYVGSKEVSV
jgi:hypothetical protein